MTELKAVNLEAEAQGGEGGSEEQTQTEQKIAKKMDGIDEYNNNDETSFTELTGVGENDLIDYLLGGVSSQRRSRFERATRSLATFVPSHRSLRSLRSLAPQRSASLRSLRSLAPFTGSLTHFAHSLVGQLKFLNMCSHCYRVSREQTRFWRSLETRPKC